MKKLTTVLAAAVLALAVSLTALAAPSVVGRMDMPGIQAKGAKVTAKTIGSGQYHKELQDQIDAMNNAKTGMTLADAFRMYQAEMGKVDVFSTRGKKSSDEAELSQYKFLSPVMDLTFDGEKPSEENPAEVTFTVNNVTDGVEVYLMHYCAEHQKWEMIAVSRTGNQIRAYIHSEGPTAIVYKDGDDVQIVPTGNAARTGEANRAGVLGGAGILFAAFGVFALSRSRKAA